MHILFTSLRNTSHFLPLIPFIDACRRRGHEVAVAAPPDLRARVAATGAAFLPFGHPGDEGLQPIWTRMRSASESDANRIAIGELFAGACAGAALPALLDIVARFRPAVIVRESQEYAAVVAAEKFAIPHVRVAISASSAETELLTYAAPAVDAHRAQLGLATDARGERLSAEPVMTLLPLSLERQDTVPSHVVRFRVARAAAPALPDWWSGRSGPFVYATLGTVLGGMEAARALYRVVLDALAGLPVRVLLTIGADLPLELLGTVPPNVHVERFVPQDEVLPHAAALICHGGSGTILGALAAGIPLVVTPAFADQPFNAERVQARGAGLAMPTKGVRPEQLRDALRRVLDEGAFRSAAREVAAEIAALPLVDEAASTLEQLASSH